MTAPARFIVGDVLDVLATLPEASVDLVLTSPPFLALRSYLPSDHPDKHREGGSQATPADYLDWLLDVTEACGRVLAPHGSLVVELGDTYAGSGGAGGDYSAQGLRSGQPPFRQPRGVRQGHESRPGGHHFGGIGWPLDKSLTFVPQIFGASLAYGRNLLDPARLTDPWRVRNVVAWCRPNPPVGALADKFRSATSHLTVACKSRSRWFDLDAVRTPHSEPIRTNITRPKMAAPERGSGGDTRGFALHSGNVKGAPPLDWWQIPTQPYKGAHYATWPERLLTVPIESMCPRHVCTECGTPRRRITSEPEYVRTDSDRVPPRLAKTNGVAVADGANQHRQEDGANTSVVRQAATVGWTDCECDAPHRPGVVLDPFAGTGTTLAAAVAHGRTAIGIDLDERNVALARQRVGMWLTAEHHTREAAS